MGRFRTFKDRIRLAKKRGQSAKDRVQSAGEREESEGVVPLIVKGDVAGSVEALVAILESRQPKQKVLKVIHTGVGDVTDTDVDMAFATKGCSKVHDVVVFVFVVVVVVFSFFS